MTTTVPAVLTLEQMAGADWHVTVAAAGLAWLNSNDRGIWHKHSGTISDWRRVAGWAARAHRVPPIDGRAYVLAELRFADRRRRDPANWYPTVKACLDGLVDARVFADDSADHVVGPDLRLGPVVAGHGGSVVLHIWRL